MNTRTLSLSFDIWAKVPDELPGPDALRSALEDALPEDFWTIDNGADWAIESIGVGPQPQAVNAELLRVARHMLTRLELEAETRKIFPGAALVPDLRAAVDAATPTPTTET